MSDVVELFLQDVVEDEQERASLAALQGKVDSLEGLLTTLIAEVRDLKASRDVASAGVGVAVTVTERDESGQIKTIRIGA